MSYTPCGNRKLVLCQLKRESCRREAPSLGRHGLVSVAFDPHDCYSSPVLKPAFSSWSPMETSHVQFPIPAQRSPLDFLFAQEEVQEVQGCGDTVGALAKLFR